MSVSVQNLRSFTPGVEPASLLPGQLCFNLADKVVFVGDGSDFKTDFEGNQVPGVVGEGWYSMPMDFSVLADYFVANPEVYGDIPANDEILTWDAGAGHPVWSPNSGAGAVDSVTGVAPVQVDNTDPENPVISIDAASTTAPGIVQLNNTTVSTSTTEALTAAQGKSLQDQIDALVLTNNLTLAGTFDASTGLVDSVTSAGITAGFVVGNPVPAPAPSNADYFLIVDVQGSSGPAGTPPYHIGDWFLSDGVAWQFLNVGFQAAYATTTAPGVVQLATNSEVQLGSNSTNAVVPSALQSKLSDSVGIVSSTTIASSTAAKTAYDAGVQGQTDAAAAQADATQALADAAAAQADATQALADAAAAQATADAAIPDATVTAKGDLIAGTGAATYSALPVGTNGQILAANSACSTGLEWIANAPDGVASVSGTSPIVVDNTDPANPIVTIDVASTTQSGAVQLNDTVTSTSTTEAATANAAKAAYDAAVAAQATANAALPKAGGTMTGLLVSDNIQVPTGKTLEVQAGGNLQVTGSANFTGTANVLIGGAFNFQAGSILDTYGIVNLLAGSNVTSFVDITFSGAGIGVVFDDASTVQAISDSTSLVSSVTAASSTAVKAAYDAALNSVQSVSGTFPINVDNTDPQNPIVSLDPGSSPWVEVAGVISPLNTGSVVDIPVGAGIDGLTVSDSANSYYTRLKPSVIDLADNVQSISVNSSTSVITHIVDSLLANTAGVVAQDETSTLTPYNIDASYLSINGVATGINIRTLPWPQIESWDSMNINIANFSGALGVQAAGLDLVLIGGDNGGGVSYMQTQPNILLEALGPLNVKPATDAVDAVQFQTSGGSKVLTVDTLTPAVKIGDSPTAYTLPIADGAAGYVLATDGAGTTSWVANAPDGVQSISVTAPINIDNTDPANPVIGVDAASTTAPGVVQLNDTTTSTSTTEALTANQGYVLQQQIDALSITSNLTLAGTFNASTGLVDNVTSAGTAAGFVNGSPLPAAAAGNIDYFVIVDVEGSTGPSGTPPYHIGDWFLSDGTTWQFLNVGFQAPYASTTADGVVRLATDAEVQAGLNTDHAVVPSSLQSKISDSTSTTSSTTIASSTAVKAAYDAGIQGQTDAAAAQATAAAALPKAGGTMTGDITFSGAGNGVVFNNASTVEAISDSVSLTSSVTAASSTAVKAAYDAAVAAAAVGGITSGTVIYVNNTTGNDSTGQRGTTKPFLTITAALAAASEGDTIFLSPGTFIENVTLSKGVNMVGTMNDQALAAGTRIQGNFTVSISGAGTKNWAISHVYFISTNATPPFSVTNNSFGAGGLASVNNCTFTQQLSTSTTQYGVATSGTWSRSLYFRECTVDGNIHHNAGTAAGASGYVIFDRLLGIGNSDFYIRATTGTLEIRNPSNSLASVFQTGGVVLVQGAASGITPNGASTTTVFGGTGFSYKGSAASVGTGTIYFSGGSNQGSGKVDIGANLIYGWTGLTIDPANLTINGAAVAYTTAVPSAANAQSITQQRPRLELLKATSTVTAANQVGLLLDNTTGAMYSVTAYDAGTY